MLLAEHVSSAIDLSTRQVLVVLKICIDERKMWCLILVNNKSAKLVYFFTKNLLLLQCDRLLSSEMHLERELKLMVFLELKFELDGWLTLFREAETVALWTVDAA